MKVSEIFHSIQGEGINLGRPAVFLRLALCNLKCVWCDTKYTWDWKRYSYEQEVREMSPDEVIAQITRFPCKHLVITGGEPLLQQKELSSLVRRLKRLHFYIEVETNGTIAPGRIMLEHVDQWNVSPKLANSKNPQHLREIGHVYKLFNGSANSYFKFVIDSSRDLAEVERLVREYDLKRERIILMPQAKNRRELEAKSAEIVELCKAHNYIFSPRLHIQLWGNKRGR